MRNITIGLAGPDWHAAANARYYAERGDGEEYAFGATPADALAKLERRETAASATFDESLVEEVAFLVVGAVDFLNEHRGASLDTYDGYMGFIGQITRHAPMLAERWSRVNTEEFSAVWLYDVTERFGREWAEELFNGTDKNPASLLDSIIGDEMGK